MDADVIVVGAGAFGCNAAWQLRGRGLEVLVVDAVDRPATQATGAAAGFVGLFSTVHHSEWGAVDGGCSATASSSTRTWLDAAG